MSRAAKWAPIVAEIAGLVVVAHWTLLALVPHFALRLPYPLPWYLAFAQTAILAFAMVTAATGRARSGDSEDLDARLRRAWPFVLGALTVGLLVVRWQILGAASGSRPFDPNVLAMRIALIDAASLVASATAAAHVFLGVVRAGPRSPAVPLAARSVTGLVLAVTVRELVPAGFRAGHAIVPWASPEALAFAMCFLPMPRGRGRARLGFVGASALLALGAVEAKLVGPTWSRFAGCTPTPEWWPFRYGDLTALREVARYGDLVFGIATASVVASAAFTWRRSATPADALAPDVEAPPASAKWLWLAVFCAALAIRFDPPEVRSAFDSLRGDVVPASRNDSARRDPPASELGETGLPRLERSPHVESLGSSIPQGPAVNLFADRSLLFDASTRTHARVCALVLQMRAQRPGWWPEIDLFTPGDVHLVELLAALRDCASNIGVEVRLWVRVPYQVEMPGIDPWPSHGWTEAPWPLEVATDGASADSTHAREPRFRARDCRAALASYDVLGEDVHRLSMDAIWLEPHATLDAIEATAISPSGGVRPLRTYLPSDRAAVERRCAAAGSQGGPDHL